MGHGPLHQAGKLVRKGYQLQVGQPRKVIRNILIHQGIKIGIIYAIGHYARKAAAELQEKGV